MDHTQALFARAQECLPGGVCASARANPAIGHPFYISRGEGSIVYDLNGRDYIDMCMSHGASLLGHNHPGITAAVSQGLEMGTICSYETEYHVTLAERITQVVPCAEMVRFAGSGTETIMHGLRLARTATNRDKIIKFEGHFHGYSDAVNFSVAPPLDEAGPWSSPHPYAQSAGVPEAMKDYIVIVPFNDPAALQVAFAEHGHRSAALIMEPINYDSGCILPEPGFVQLCRDLCDRYGVLLFFDEVLTAFRVGVGGGQAYWGVTPDICVLGKAFGGGTPISALAGKQHIMQHLRPTGNSEMSGTYLAHLTTVLAASKAIEEYSRPGFYEYLDAIGDRFYNGFQEIIERSGVRMRLQYAGPRFGMYFGISDKVTQYRQAARQNYAMLLTFIAGCINRGVYFHVSPHHGFSAAHTLDDMERVLGAIEGAMIDVKRSFSNVP